MPTSHEPLSFSPRPFMPTPCPGPTNTTYIVHRLTVLEEGQKNLQNMFTDKFRSIEVLLERAIGAKTTPPEKTNVVEVEHRQVFTSAAKTTPPTDKQCQTQEKTDVVEVEHRQVSTSGAKTTSPIAKQCQSHENTDVMEVEPQQVSTSGAKPTPPIAKRRGICIKRLCIQVRTPYTGPYGKKRAKSAQVHVKDLYDAKSKDLDCILWPLQLCPCDMDFWAILLGRKDEPWLENLHIEAWIVHVTQDRPKEA